MPVVPRPSCVADVCNGCFRECRSASGSKRNQYHPRNVLSPNVGMRACLRDHRIVTPMLQSCRYSADEQNYTTERERPVFAYSLSPHPTTRFLSVATLSCGRDDEVVT